MKKFVVITIILLVLAASYFGTEHYLNEKNAIEDIPIFNAFTYEHGKYGRIPRTSMKLSKNALRALMRTYDNGVAMHNDGRYTVEFETENKVMWVVEIDAAHEKWLFNER